MKLQSEEVERIVDKLFLGWKIQKLVTLKTTDAKVRTRMVELVLADLRKEEDLNKEVDQILSKYEKQFENGELDRHKMFQMVKNQLIKERGLVL